VPTAYRNPQMGADMGNNQYPCPEPRGLSREFAAAYIGIGTTLFDQLIEQGVLPKPARLQGRVIWDRRRLDRHLDRLFDETELDDPFARVAA
jgi:predicted DNA-binding transcriptional regulator AlpA